MKIQYKLSFIIFAIGVVALIVASASYYYSSHRASTQLGLEKLELASEESAHQIQVHLEEQSITAITLSSAPVIRQALIQSNEDFSALPHDTRKQKIGSLNRKWLETKGSNDPFIQARLVNPVADYLKRQQEIFPDKYSEIFLTNRFGVMIASTGKLTTLAHAHKYWWLESYRDGKGRIFFDDRGFDTSAEGYVLGLVVPIWEKNEIIGIMKCNINIMGSLSHILEIFSDKQYGTAKIIRSGGLIVLEPGKEPLSTQISEQVLKELRRDETQSTIIHQYDTDRLVAIAPIILTLGSKEYGFGGSYESIDHIKGNTGEGWHVVIFLDKKELDTITVKSTQVVSITGIIFIFVISIVALMLGRKIANPIEKLVQTTKSIGEGHLDSTIAVSSKDEIGVLSESINSMTRNLQREMIEKEQASKKLKNIEWLLEKTINPHLEKTKYSPPYGDLLPLNKKRLLLDSVGEEVLQDIVDDFLDLLDTSSAIYETNGDYALGLFSSGWCRFLDNASRNLCSTKDNQKALDSGLWLCHESCWAEASKTAIETGQPTDIECNGGIHLYAIPITSGQEIIGAINFGYGSPPTDKQKLKEIADKYGVTMEELYEKAEAYETRPQYILDIAKKRIISAAKLIGEIVKRKKAEELLHQAYLEMEQRVQDRTRDLDDSNRELRGYSEKQVVLLREVNHRVKNNLTAIISMLHQEEDRANIEGKKEYEEHLQELVSRISGLLTVHSLLSSTMWEPLPLSQLSQDIIKGTLNGVHSEKSHKIDIPPSDVLVNSDQAHYLTIVLNELTTNSTKYALLDRDSVHIQVSIHKQDDSNLIVFQDDGPGFPEFVLDGKFSETCVGFNLISGIVRQSLQGKMKLSNDAGAIVKITFPAMVDK